MPSSSLPSSHSDMPMSHAEKKETLSLIKPTVAKAKRPILLWLVVLLLLGGTGFLGYMVYTQQNTLVAFQDSFTQWTTQVTTLQSSYDTSLRSVNDKLLTLETNTTSIQQNLELMKTARTAEPTPTEEPGMISEEPGMMTGTGSEVAEPNGGEEGLDPAMNEFLAYESFLDEAKQGNKKTVQPDGITLIQSRLASLDGNLLYNVFSSKSDPNDLYLYIQRLNPEVDFEAGWYGPFAAPAAQM